MRVLRHAVGLAWSTSPKRLLAYAGLAVFGGTAPVAVAAMTRLVLDRVVARPGAGAVLWPAATLITITAVTALAPHWSTYLRAELGRALNRKGLDRLHRTVARFAGLARFEDPAYQDRLRLAQQACGDAAFLIDSGQAVITGALTLVGFIAALAVLSPVMTIVLIVAGVPTLLAELMLARRHAGLLLDISPVERREVFYSQLLLDLRAAKEIRLFGLAGWLRDRMLAQRRDADAARRALDLRDARIQTGLSLLGVVVSGGGMLWAFTAAATGRLSVGDVAMFIAAVPGTQNALTLLVVQVGHARQQLLQFGQYVAVVTAPPDIPEPPAAAPLPPLRAGIELRDVWFRYGDNLPWVLRGVSLRIPHGRSVALVGANGEGKSTLVKLLCRFYDPTRGAILWDGVDIRDLSPAELRRRITAVFQDYMEYELTAAENIALGDLSALDDSGRIAAAARLAGIAPTLAGLPDGYQTLLTRIFAGAGEDGVVLSGGQWQRVALARALLRGSGDLMILDEPSSGLDAEAEHEIHRRLTEHRNGRTSLLISHRLAAVRDADEIVVLAGGVVAERGRHDTLLAEGGTYARLFTLQAAGYARTAG